jgi:hypothetical protein
LSNQQVDILAFWLPHWSALGEALRAGHVPTWLPNQFGGVPFASDPQSGWLYLPAMLLFTILPGARAMEWFIVLQPILAGLGIYWFLRHEGLGRPASTFGGLALALPIAASGLVLSMPFAGTLAWTAMTLAGASGLVRARKASSIAGWLALTAFFWTQIAAAHLTDGLLIGTAVLAVYLVARTAEGIRRHERTFASAVVLAGALVDALVVLSAAAWLPRLELIPRTAIGMGYGNLGRLSNRLTGMYSLPPLAIHGLGPWWPTAFARGLGGYLGAAAILMVPVAFFAKRFRWPAIGFALLAGVGWMLNLDVFITSVHVRRLATSLGIGELWLRDPSRFRYLVLLTFAILAGYGLQVWLDAGSQAVARSEDDASAAARRQLWWLLPGAAVFVVGPLLAGASVRAYLPFLVGAAYATPLLYVGARGRSWAGPALALLLAVELTTFGIVGQYGPPPVTKAQGLTLTYDPGLGPAFAKLHAPALDPRTYLAPGPIGVALQDRASDGERYFSFDRRIAIGSSRGFLSHQTDTLWPAYENGRSIMFGLNEIQGYSPIQLLRYWRLVRASNTVPIFFNSATFQSANPSVLRLFGVGTVITPTSQGPPGPAPSTPPPGCAQGSLCSWPAPKPIATEGNFTLWSVPWAEPRASFVPAANAGTVTPAQSLRAVLDPSFDPAATVLFEGPASSGGALPATKVNGGATYREDDAEHVVATTSSSVPGWLVVRNVYDRNWHATVDGRTAQVRQADYLMQAVAVPAGHHVVTLTYRDPAIGVGMVVTVAGWAFLVWLIWWLRRRDRRGQEPPVASEEAVPSEPADRAEPDVRAAPASAEPAEPALPAPTT